MDNDFEDKEVKEVKEVSWEQVSNELGGHEMAEIKFRKNRKPRRIGGFFKGIAFVLIAALSGGATSYYVVNQKTENIYTPNDQTSIQNLGQPVKTAEIPTSAVGRVAQGVGPAVVGITNQVEGARKQLITQGMGSGIIFDSRGYIVTNNHVVEGGNKFTVKLSSGKELPAKLVGTDSRTDLAVIKVDVQNLPVAKFGDSSKVKVGDLAVAIGNPLGDEFAGSVTAGIISALNRKINIDDAVYHVLQTDAAINPGNSGGALCNAAGEVIGINSLKLANSVSQEGNVEGMGFAIAINEAKGIIKSLMENGKVVRPWLGISSKPLEEGTLPNGVSGVYVYEVIPGTGAAAAGVKPTDVITELDKVKINTVDDIHEILDKHKVGDAVPCKVWRNGKTVELNIILSESKPTTEQTQQPEQTIPLLP